MATHSSQKNYDDATSLNRKIDKLKQELKTIEYNNKDRNLTVDKSNYRRIERIHKAINQLMRERDSILKQSLSVKIEDNEDDFNDREWDVKTEGNYEAIKKKQEILKKYYENFPNIDDIINETNSNLNEAKQFTERILKHVPSGKIDERTTACHVIHKLMEHHHIQCLFFDSKNETQLYDASADLLDLYLDYKPFVLKLNNFEGLGNYNLPKTDHGTIRFIEMLNKLIASKESHPLTDEICRRLADVYDVDQNRIIIQTIFIGTFNIVYIVKDTNHRIKQNIATIVGKLKSKFDQFSTVKIHPLFYCPSFDICLFEQSGNKTFPNRNENFKIGPPGKVKSCLSPAGWTQYALKVLDKYEDGNAWLQPSHNPDNWYRAYVGIGNGDSRDLLDKKITSMKAVLSAYNNDFHSTSVTKHENNVYCSPNPKFLEDGFAPIVELDTDQGKKMFKFMLQVAVNPASVQFTPHKDIWIVSESKNIRSYGILIKEV